MLYYCDGCRRNITEEQAVEKEELITYWGRPITDRYLACPECGEELNKKDIREIITETCELICDQFCKFGGTGNENGCCWCQTHENQCPLDALIKAAEET